MKNSLWKITLFTLVAVLMLINTAQVYSQSSTTVSVWLTTAGTDGRTVVKGLEQQPNISFATTTPAANPVIQINEGTTYQQMVGFGASLTDSSAWLMGS